MLVHNAIPTVRLYLFDLNVFFRSPRGRYSSPLYNQTPVIVLEILCNTEQLNETQVHNHRPRFKRRRASLIWS